MIGDCASPDSLERINRLTFQANISIDNLALGPVSRAYKGITPSIIKTGASNFFKNMALPAIFISDILVLDTEQASITAARFFTNTTFGLFGLFDVASKTHDLDIKTNDIGLSLAHYGLYPGQMIQLPLIGPSNIRHSTGIIGSSIIESVALAAVGLTPPVALGYAAWKIIDVRASVDGALKIRDELALDKYTFTNSLWCQNRESQLGLSNSDNWDDWEE